jgi:hypothetical protein
MAADNTLSISWSRIKKMLFGGATDNPASDQIFDEVEKQVTGIFDSKELDLMASLANRTKRVGPIRETQVPFSDLLNLLQDTTKSTKSIIDNLKKLRAVNPEIAPAEQIIVSSIMSPNDMNSDKLSISVEDTKIDAAVTKKIVGILEDYFNKTHSIPCERWLQETLFQNGAVAALIMPKSVLDNISTAVADKMIALESMFTSTDTSKKFTMASGSIDLNEVEHELYAMEGLYEDIEKKDHKVIQDFIKQSPSKLISYFSSSDRQDQVAVVDDITSLTKAAQMKYRKDELGQKYKDKFKAKDPFEDVQVDPTKQKADFISIDQMVGSPSDHPIVIELPVESVIPVCIPGNKSEHLGYFVITDEWGTPIAGNEIADAENYANMDQAYKAMFGYDNKSLSNKKKYELANSVFDISVKKLLNAKLKDMAYNGVQLSTYNAVASTIFHRVIKNKKTRLVFVPDNFIMYCRFDHREDGTGKTSIEDASFILSLRTTFLVCNIMALAKEAVEHKTVEFDMPEHETNPEGFMAMVRKILIENGSFKFTNDPNSIVAGIVNNAITIKPKNLPGLEDFNLQVQTEGKTRQKADPDLLDRLNSMFATSLGIPHSVFNLLSENEFSRSVATSNLIFSNKIKKLQKQFCTHLLKYVHLYVDCSEFLKNEIYDVIKSYINTNDVKDPSEDNIRKIYYRAINSLTISLPEPNVAVDRSHYEDFRSFMEMLESVVQIIFNSDMIPIEDREAQDYLKGMQMYVKRIVLNQYVSQFSHVGIINQIPEFVSGEEIMPNEFQDFYQKIKNSVQGMKNTKEAVEIKNDDSGGGSSW